MEERDYFEQAMAEIRSRQVIQGIWAQAFAESEGDQRKTMARYISLRADQLKSESHSLTTAPPPAAEASWIKRILQWLFVVILVKVIGPIPGILTFAAYAWLVRKRGLKVALIGSLATGICLTLLVAVTIPNDLRPDFEYTNPTTPTNEAQRIPSEQFSPSQTSSLPSATAAASPPLDPSIHAALREVAGRFPYFNGPDSEKWARAVVAWSNVYSERGELRPAAIRHGAQMVDRYRAAGSGACYPIDLQANQIQCE